MLNLNSNTAVAAMNPFNTSLTTPNVVSTTATGTFSGGAQVGVLGNTQGVVPTMTPSVQASPGQFQMFQPAPPVATTIGTSGSPAVFTPELLSTSASSVGTSLVPSVPLAPGPAASTAALFSGGGPFVPGGSPFVPGGSPFVPGRSPFVPGGSPFVPGGSPLVPGGIPQPTERSPQVTVTAKASPLLTDITAGATPAPLTPVNIGTTSVDTPLAPQPVVSLN